MKAILISSGLAVIIGEGWNGRSLFKNGLPQTLFVYFRSVQTQILQEKLLESAGFEF